MSDAEMADLAERIAEAVVRRLERSQRRAPAGYWSLADVARRRSRKQRSYKRRYFL